MSPTSCQTAPPRNRAAQYTGVREQIQSSDAVRLKAAGASPDADNRSGSRPIASRGQLPDRRTSLTCQSLELEYAAMMALSESPTDLTTPLRPPRILSWFDSLSAGRCTLPQLSRWVLEACRADPGAADGVLLLLDEYRDAGKLKQFDFRPLQRELQRRARQVDEPVADTGPIEETDARPPDPPKRRPIRDRDPTQTIAIATPAPAIAAPVADSPVSDVPVAEVSVKEAIDEAPASTAAPVAPVGTQTILRDRYILHDEIGRGGAGIVYLAFDRNRAGLPHDQQYVALKVVRDEHARRPETLHALRREFHQAQSLSHPGIVNVFDFDHDGDTYFVTMELLDGESLGELIRRLLPNKLPLETATRILRELGDAIVYAHDRGVLHLDLKPDNVMVDADGHVRVLDFGIAQTQMAEPRTPQMRSAPPAATPAYASCERLVQERADVRDDIFSFSCIAYELLAGKHPFDRSSALKARKDDRKARRIRDLSRRQWAALESGLAWAREDRPANMRELLQGLALQSSAPAGTPTRRVTGQRAAAVTLVMLGSAALLNWARIQDRTQSPGETSATPVDAKPVSEGVADEVSRNTPETFAATTVSSQAVREAAAPVTPASTLEIESEGAVAQPRSLPADTGVETGDLDSRPSRSSSRTREVSAAGEALAAAPRATAAPADVLGFSRHSFSVSEADAVVHVNVRRLGGATGDIAFQWYTVDDSARAGQDYVYGFGEVLMAPGQTTATFDVPIVTDTIREDPELLQVIIGSSRGAHVGA